MPNLTRGGGLRARRGAAHAQPHALGGSATSPRNRSPSACGLPAVLVNDASSDLAAVGDPVRTATARAAGAADDMVYLTISTGIGGGVVIGRRAAARVAQQALARRSRPDDDRLPRAADPRGARLRSGAGASLRAERRGSHEARAGGRRGGARLARRDRGGCDRRGRRERHRVLHAGARRDRRRGRLGRRAAARSGPRAAGGVCTARGCSTPRRWCPGRRAAATIGVVGLRGAWPLWEYASSREGATTLAPRAPAGGA